jgi:type IV secretory pathway TrbD component
MDAAVLEVVGGWLRVVGIVGGLLAAASLLVWLVIGVVLWFVRGTRRTQAPATEPDWYDALPEDTTPLP